MPKARPSSDTRTAFLEAATTQFSDKGFYGASIASIASDLGLTKQALIHHFGSKEQLYGEVLQRIADQLGAVVVEAVSEESDPSRQLERLLGLLFDTRRVRPEQTVLITRELLDNRPRAQKAGTWYLKSFLNALIALIKRVPGWESASDGQALAAVYQLLGAINYYAISEPTLTRMFGKQVYRTVDEAFPPQLQALIAACLENPPSAR
ncbi:MAG: TetR/AcrR family transcriptional regulator [Myxococcota bacterium]